MLKDHNIELWPGYVTSIPQFENNILMNAEITHKVMRTDTVFDFLTECTRNYQNDWKVILKSFKVLIGESFDSN